MDPHRLKLRRFIIPVICIGIIFYFSRNSYEGEFGLVAHQRFKEKIVELNKELGELRSIEAALKADLKLLNPESPNKDMLDERIRLMLNLSSKYDIILFVDQAESKKT